MTSHTAALIYVIWENVVWLPVTYALVIALRVFTGLDPYDFGSIVTSVICARLIHREVQAVGWLVDAAKARAARAISEAGK